MPDVLHTDASAPVFRVDKFVVPAESLPEFVAQLRRAHQILATLPGCQQKHVLTQTGGDGQFNVVTVVEWANAQAVASAQAVMQGRFEEEGFDPATFRRKLGVRGDSGFYSRV
ncbi:antibiotic biosynthesis monooxygenase [Polaromonas aquatica]|uniref:antibiotic biosynthesis monooxygenase n=1 Tax=Polaromonas aquatica TaxID=332657 RepID=UPI003D660BBB